MSNRDRRTFTRHLPHTMVYCALLAALPQAASALDLDYQLGLRMLHSDNISLIEDDSISETVISPQLRFTLEENSPVLQASLRGDVQYLHYQSGSYDNETRGEFEGDLEWTVLPDRIKLMAANTLSQQSVNTLASFSPGNQQQINVFVAGPSFYARFGEVTRGELDLRYTNSHAEETEGFNNDRYNLAARLGRMLNATDQLLLNFETTQVEFDTFSDIYNYKRHDAYVTYRSQLSSVELLIDAGYSRLQPEGNVESESGSLLRANVVWQATANSVLRANFRNEFADATQDLVVGIGEPGNPGGNPDNPDLQVIPDNFRQKQLRLFYEYNGERLQTQLAPYYQQLRYLRDTTFDADSHGVRFNATYQLPSQTSLLFTANRESRDLYNQARKDVDITLGIGLEKRFSRHWGGALEYRHRDRDSSLAGQGFVENMVQFSFSFYR